MLPSWYEKYKNFIDDSITDFLENEFSQERNYWLDEIKEATIYSCKWWKRIRSILALEFFIIFSWIKFESISKSDDIVKFLIALELLHSYSLVHDDLPCMDNDDFRRWELTTWKKYNDTTATLVWDLLNSLSLQLVWEINNSKLTSYFWKAVWIKWMLWWQVLDIFYEKNPWRLTLEYLKEIHDKKTWALIDSSIVWWIYLANEYFDKRQDLETKEKLNIFLDEYNDFWFNLWRAFQLKDDLLDYEWTFEETWKSVWDNEQKWYVYFMWMEKTKEELWILIDKCFNLSNYLWSEKIDFLIKYIWTRKK